MINMKVFAGILVVSLVSACWGSPAEFPSRQGAPTNEELNEILDATDMQIDEAIRSIDKASKMLNNNPQYTNFQKSLENSASESGCESNGPLPQLANEDDSPEEQYSQETLHPVEKAAPGLELEFDTTKLILKNKKNVVSHKFKKNYYPEQRNLPQSDVKLSAQQMPEGDRFMEQQLLDQQAYMNQQILNQQQEQQQTKEDLAPESSILDQMMTQKCDMNCENAGNPVCGVNANNRYSIFENMCEMDVSNCIDPALDWQLLPRDMCKGALHNFYLRLHKYFSLDDDAVKINMKNKK